MGLMQKDPRKRLSFPELLEHSFLAKNQSSDKEREKKTEDKSASASRSDKSSTLTTIAEQGVGRSQEQTDILSVLEEWKNNGLSEECISGSLLLDYSHERQALARS